MWSIITIVILVLIVAVLALGVAYINVGKLKPLNEDALIYSFGGDPSLSSTQNNITLQCPTGKSIKVLDAWYEPYDPNYQFMGDDTMGLYGTDDDGNVIGPIDKQGNVSGSLDDDVWSKTSNATHLPDNDGQGIYSKVCKYSSVEGKYTSGSGHCLIVNALPLVSTLANGLQSAKIHINDDSSLLPSPCVGEVPGKSGSLNIHDSNENYDNLKYFLPMGSPTTSDVTDSSSVVNGQQGYTLHGIYTCVVD